MSTLKKIAEKLSLPGVGEIDPKREIIAGLTTFMTMAYILFVNPAILSATGMPRDSLVIATAASAGLATLIMALYAKSPMALAPGMGLNAYFAYTVTPYIRGILEEQGLDPENAWRIALAAVFVEGLVFIVLSVTKLREAVANAIPLNLKYAIAAGIGLFLTLIGLKNAGLVYALVEPVSEGAPYGRLSVLEIATNFFHDPTTLIALTFTLVAGILMALRVPGALLISIILAIIASAAFGYTHAPEQLIGTPKDTLVMAFDLHGLLALGAITATVIVFTFFVVDFFDTLGTVTGLASIIGIVDEKGRVKGIGRMLLTDAVGTTAGAALGTSTVTTYIESAAGIEEGGKTGLTALVVALLFFASILIWPVFTVAPEFSTAPALIIVGLLMARAIKKIDLDDLTEAVPAFLTIISMPFFFSISDGIGIGFISYVVMKLLTGKIKDLNPIIVGVAIVFAAYFYTLPYIR
ncbi:MAG: NCS2 family permease [Desulfurococcales archaeon]|nr:NCS2 family permease [Desulfurococcales archaeon]